MQQIINISKQMFTLFLSSKEGGISWRDKSFLVTLSTLFTKFQGQYIFADNQAKV